MADTSPVTAVITHEHAAPGASAAMAPDLAALFRDADQHGPRGGKLITRLVAPVTVLAVACALAVLPAWRTTVAGAVDGDLARIAFVVPVLAGLLLCAAVLAPLVRVGLLRLLVPAAVTASAGVLLVSDGQLLWSSVPLAGAALLVGAAAARAVRRAVWVLPLLLVAALSDAHSVAAGTTRGLLGADRPAAAEVVAAQLPTRFPPSDVRFIDYVVLHLPSAEGFWMVGLVDIAAISLLLGLSHMYWLPVRRAAPALGAVLAAAAASGATLPLLPLLGVAWLAVNIPLVWRSTVFSVRRALLLES